MARHGRQAAILCGVGVGELVLGRERELGVLATALDGAARSVGRLVVLVGEPGIGKTTLLAETVRLAEARGVACAVGRCHHDQDEAPPYWPWIQVLRRLRRLGRLGEDHGWLLRALQGDGGEAGAGAPRAHSRFEIADRTVHALAEAADDGPLLVGIDDLHAADPSSLRIVEFLAAVLDDLPLAVVATSRAPQPATPFEALLVETLRHPAAGELVVSGLSVGDVAAYLDSAIGQGAGMADEVWHLTAGNPLFVREVARILGASDSGQVDRVPVRLTGALRTRLAGLSPPARLALDALAVLGPEADIALLSGVAGDGAGVDAAVSEAASADVIEVATAGPDTLLRFRHPLLREAVYGDLPAASRRMLHERAAAVLATRPTPPPGALAIHLCAAARPETAAAAVEAARAAAEGAAAIHAHEEAAAHLARAQGALALLPDHGPEDEVELLLEAAAAYRHAGLFERALDRYGAACAQAEGAGLAARGAQAALGYEETVCESGQARSGSGDRSIVQLERAIERGERVEVALRARLEAALARACFFVNQGARAEALAGAAVDDARAAGDPESIAFALECLRTVTWAQAGRERRAGLCTDIARYASAAGKLDLLLQAHHFALYPALEDGDLGEVDRLVAEYGGLAEQAQQPHARCYAALFRSMRAIQRAEVVAARRQLDGAEALDGRIRSLNVAQFCTAQRFSIARMTGDWGDLPDRFAAFVGPTGSGPTWRCMTAHLAAESGDADTAHAELERMAHGGYRAVSADAHYLFSLCCLAEAAILLADRTRAGELLDLLEPHQALVVPNITALHGNVAHACGGLALVCGNGARARALLDAALATHLALGSTSWATFSRLRLAEALLAGPAGGDGERAGELAEAAAATAEARGLARLGRRAADLLGRPAPAAAHPLDQLTARELDVVALIAEGRSNSDIARELYISLKTVKSHVSHVLTKLDVTSRTQVAVLVQRARGTGPGPGTSPAYQSKDR
jgi:DNA-binding CsgD family transcriptional regulator